MGKMHKVNNPSRAVSADNNKDNNRASNKTDKAAARINKVSSRSKVKISKGNAVNKGSRMVKDSRLKISKASVAKKVNAGNNKAKLVNKVKVDNSRDRGVNKANKDRAASRAKAVNKVRAAKIPMVNQPAKVRATRMPQAVDLQWAAAQASSLMLSYVNV